MKQKFKGSRNISGVEIPWFMYPEYPLHTQVSGHSGKRGGLKGSSEPPRLSSIGPCTKLSSESQWGS